MGKNGKAKTNTHIMGAPWITSSVGYRNNNVLGCSGLGVSTEASPKKWRLIDFRRVFFPQSSSVRLAQHGGPNSAGVPSLDSKGVKIHGRVKNWPLTWRTNIHNIAISWRSWFAMVQIPSDCKDLAFEYPWPFLLVGRSSCHHPQPPF